MGAGRVVVIATVLIALIDPGSGRGILVGNVESPGFTIGNPCEKVAKGGNANGPLIRVNDMHGAGAVQQRSDEKVYAEELFFVKGLIGLIILALLMYAVSKRP